MAWSASIWLRGGTSSRRAGLARPGTERAGTPSDAEMGERRGRSEEQHAPLHAPGEQPRFRQPGVDRGDEHALTEEVREQPADQQDQRGGEQGRQERHQERRRPGRAWQGQAVDADAREQDEDGPEADEPENLGRQAQDTGAAQRGRHPPALQEAVDPDRPADPGHHDAGQPAEQEPHRQQGHQDEQPGDDGEQPLADLEEPRPHVARPSVAHSKFPYRPYTRYNAAQCVGSSARP